MIKVMLFENENGRLNGFKVEGHAGYAPCGQDIVCAAVSVLAQTTVMALNKYLITDVKVQARDGCLVCCLPRLDEPEREKAALILGIFEIGITSTRAQYSRYIKVGRKRRRCQ